MVLEHELTARCAAGSLGGTLGRLNESLRRLSRAQNTGSREQPGDAADADFEPARLALLNQTLRLMADAWQCGSVARRHFDHLEDQLDSLKDKALNFLGAASGRPAGRDLSEYHLLAVALDGLKAEDRHYRV
jgi:hypothetical protein